MHTNPQLAIPEIIISAAATILRQYAPEITSDFLKAALARYYDYGDNPDHKRLRTGSNLCLERIEVKLRKSL